MFSYSQVFLWETLMAMFYARINMHKEVLGAILCNSILNILVSGF